MLDVKRLRVLREVAARGSFSAAADALSYTQSAVSQQIAALEREAGAQLVERSARGVRLTEAGRVLVGHADAILARLADAEAELEAIAGLRGGRLRMVSFPSGGATIMPTAIAEFRRRHPAVELALEPAEPADAAGALRAGECDLALSVENPFRPDGEVGIRFDHVMDDPMHLVLPADHPLARRPNVKIADLADESWIASSSGGCPDTAILLRACQVAGFEPRIAFVSDDYLAVQGFIAAGMGVSLIPDLALLAVRDDVAIRSLSGPAPSRHVVAATLAEGYRSPAADAMLEVLAETGRAFEGKRRELALAS
jgi:DNA-binding transcriptional LysR family regulator